MKGMVKVRSESELRPGMTVWTKNCEKCGGHSRVLLAAVPHSPDCGTKHGPCTARSAWTFIGGCPRGSGVSTCFHDSIKVGRLYRARPFGQQETEGYPRKQTRTIENTRERETVR